MRPYIHITKYKKIYGSKLNHNPFLYLFERSIFASPYIYQHNKAKQICSDFNARMAKLVNVAVSEAVENCLLRVRVSLRARLFKVKSLQSKVQLELRAKDFIFIIRKPGWRNWQTHHLEGVAFARMYEFESRSGHTLNISR